MRQCLTKKKNILYVNEKKVFSPIKMYNSMDFSQKHSLLHFKTLMHNLYNLCWYCLCNFMSNFTVYQYFILFSENNVYFLNFIRKLKLAKREFQCSESQLLELVLIYLWNDSVLYWTSF